MFKKLALLLCTALCVASFTGCGGKKEKAEMKYYSLEEMNLSLGEDEYPSNPTLVDNNLYFMTNKYPDYPQQYYDDMALIDQKLNGGDSAVDPLDGSEDEGAADDAKPTDEPAATDEPSDSGSGDEPSDEDLTGDLDDVFGDDSSKDAEPTDEPADSEEPTAEPAADDAASGDVAVDAGNEVPADGSEADPSRGDQSLDTYEDLEKKYSDYKSKVCLWKYSLESKEKTSVLELEMNNGSIDGYHVNEDGTFSLFNYINTYDESTASSKTDLELIYFGADGKETDRKPLNDQFKDIESDNFYTNKVIFDKDGGLIVSYGEKSICRLDKDGKKLWDIEADNYVDSCVLDKNGDIIISYYDDKGEIFAKIDESKKAVGEPIKGILEEDGTGYYMLYPGTNNYDIVLKDSTSLYSYDEASASKTALLKWMDSGLVGDRVEQAFSTDDGGFIVMYSNDDGTYKFGKLTESEDQTQAASKEIITLAAAYMDSTAQQKVIEFNKKNDKYKIEIKSYENEDDPSAKLGSDIVAGNIPDIIDVSGIDINNFAAKGIFEDLTPYMEKDDTLKSDFYVDGLLDATKIDDKQYFLMKYFNIISLVGKESDLGKFKDGWNVNDVIEYYKSKPSGTQLFESDCKMDNFSSMFDNDINSYIDWKTGEVAFNGENFKNMLEFCNTFPQEYNYEESTDVHSMFKDNKLLLTRAYISSTEEIQMYKGLLEDDVAYVGYPTSSGIGIYIQPSMSYGIASSSEHKDAAWEFIKSFLTSEDSENDRMMSFPASSAAFEDMIKKDSAKESYTDDKGNKVEPRQSSYGYGDYEINIGPATDDEIQTLRDLIKKASGINVYNNSAMTMITDEVNQYFTGDKKLDEIVDVLQDKMVKYVNENK